MNAKELMIGDWVINTEGKEQIRDVVRKISPEFLGLRYSRRYVPIECIEPIPLTPEILERNGFSEDYRYDDLSYIQSCGAVTGIHINGKNGLMDEMYLKYVHELQHAFRMLQFDDLADNFKVI